MCDCHSKSQTVWCLRANIKFLAVSDVAMVNGCPTLHWQLLRGIFVRNPSPKQRLTWATLRLPTLTLESSKCSYLWMTPHHNASSFTFFSRFSIMKLAETFWGCNHSPSSAPRQRWHNLIPNKLQAKSLMRLMSTDTQEQQGQATQVDRVRSLGAWGTNFTQATLLTFSLTSWTPTNNNISDCFWRWFLGDYIPTARY